MRFAKRSQVVMAVVTLFAVGTLGGCAAQQKHNDEMAMRIESAANKAENAANKAEAAAKAASDAARRAEAASQKAEALFAKSVRK